MQCAAPPTVTHSSTFTHAPVDAVQEAQPAPQAQGSVRVPCGGFGFHVQIWRPIKIRLSDTKLISRATWGVRATGPSYIENRFRCS